MVFNSSTPTPAPPATTPATPPVQACPACPDMEIEINDTPATNDDLVLLKCEHPAHRSTTRCRIRAVACASGTATVAVLVNPDGRLRFSGATDTTRTVSLPANGAWVSFEISGETASAAMNDAVINAHCGTATGAVKGTKTVTVVSYDQAQMNVTVGATGYALTGGAYAITGGNAVDFAAQARIRPAGVNCAAPQLTNLRIGLLQNELASLASETTWTRPTITWNPGVAKGTTVTVPTSFRETINHPVRANDSEASVAPLYDQPSKTGTLDAGSLVAAMGCTGSGTATSSDTPSSPAPPSFALPAKRADGTVVGRITYNTLVNVRIIGDWVIWATLFNTSNNHVCLLRERTWSMNVDSAVTAPPQKCTAGAADQAPTMDPITAPPFSNTIVNAPANSSTAGTGAATTTFTRP